VLNLKAQRDDAASALSKQDIKGLAALGVVTFVAICVVMALLLEVAFIFGFALVLWAVGIWSGHRLDYFPGAVLIATAASVAISILRGILGRV
jgi:hypothetical protein